MSEEAKGEHVAVPLTIVTGFLGAGKTTLMNRLLAQLVERKQKVAIIQNEFSDLGVEDAMVVGSDGDVFNDIVELANGCVCCTVKDDFVAALETLVKQNRFTYFLLECSGLADPASLIEQFWIDEGLESEVALDGVVTVVDAFHLHKQLEVIGGEVGQLISQIAYADRVLLNKTDLVSKDIMSKLRDDLSSINSSADFFDTHNSNVDVADVLNIKAFSNEVDVRQRSRDVTSTHQHSHGPSPSSANNDENAASKPSTSSSCIHDHSISSLILEETKSSRHVSKEKLDEWLAALLWADDPPYSIFRMKAVLNVDQSSQRHYLQAVQKLFEVSEGGEWEDDASRATRFVVIGRHLEKAELQSGFESIFCE